MTDLWKDVTSYSRSDTERKPTSFAAVEGQLRITITCGHIYHRPQWVMHCQAIGIDTHPLRLDLTKEQAEAEALAVVSMRLAQLTKCAERLKAATDHARSGE